MINYEELSKEVSYALRHAPWEYELEMDEEGWVLVEQLVDALNKNMKWIGVSEEDLSVMIEKSEKKRHEISSGKIRAFYGHSIPMHIVKEKKTPPDILYHGTARRFMSNIKSDGLLPQGRQYVHLSRQYMMNLRKVLCLLGATRITTTVLCQVYAREFGEIEL